MKEIFEASLTEESIKLQREFANDPEVTPYGASGNNLKKMKSLKFDLDRVWKLMNGLIDLHCHSGVGATSTRVYDILDMAKQAAEVGQRAIVSKAHNVPTNRCSAIAQKSHNEWAKENNKRAVDLFGGVVLNYAVGGLNPDAVISSYRLGGKYVWLPTIDSAHHRKILGGKGGIKTIDDDGKVVKELMEILYLISESEMILGICHQSTKERIMIVEEAVKMGIKKIEINHINYPLSRMTIEQAKSFAEKGAMIGIYIEGFRPPSFNIEESLKIIKEVGAKNIVIASDCGHIEFPSPVEAFRLMITELLIKGISDEDIERMVKINPEFLLY
jgi:predicted metal-dependent TIM-barrel fold hydrolase